MSDEIATKRPTGIAPKAPGVTRLAEKVVKRSLRAVAIAFSNLEDEEKVKEDSRLPPAQAPMYLHMAMKMASAAIKDDKGPSNVSNTLNVTLIKQSESREQWIKDVDAFQKLPKMIYVAKKKP
jgi:hypothetical protein